MGRCLKRGQVLGSSLSNYLLSNMSNLRVQDPFPHVSNLSLRIDPVMESNTLIRHHGRWSERVG